MGRGSNKKRRKELDAICRGCSAASCFALQRYKGSHIIRSGREIYAPHWFGGRTNTSPGLASTQGENTRVECEYILVFCLLACACVCVCTAADAASFLSRFPHPGGNDRDDTKRQGVSHEKEYTSVDDRMGRARVSSPLSSGYLLWFYLSAISRRTHTHAIKHLSLDLTLISFRGC